MTNRLRGVLAALTFAAVVAAGVGLTASPAHAADPGPGYDYDGDPHSHLGGYRTSGGDIGYCIDAAKGSPAGGVTSNQGVVERVNGRSDAVMLQLSWVLRRYGNTNDDDTAAAVALVVWGLADPVDHAARGGDEFVITRAPASARAHILALADQIRDAARTYRMPGSPNADLTLTLDPAAPGHGVLEVGLDPEGSVGTVNLRNAVFSDTGLATRDGVGDGQTFAIEGVAPDGQSEYSVTAIGTFQGESYADGSVRVWATPGAQTIASESRRLPTGFVASVVAQVVVPTPPVTPPLPRVAG